MRDVRAAGARLLRGAGLRRAGWTVADQALTSLGNLLLAVFVARAVPVGEFGAFAIAFAAYLFVAGISRAVGTDPLVVRHSTATGRDMARATSAAVGSVLAVGLALGVVVALVGVVLPDPVGPALLGLGAVLAALLVQDAWRFAFFAAGEPRKAAVNDTVRIAVVVALVIWLTAGGADTAWVFVLAWGAGAAVTSLLGCAQARLLPRPAALRSWWRDNRDLSKDFVGEHVALSGAGELSTVVVAVVAGVSAAAALRGAHVAFGAVTVFLQSGVALAVPEGRRLWERAPERLERVLRLGSAALMALPLGWLLVLLLVPDPAGVALLGETWEPASSLFPAYALYMIATGATLGASIGLRVLERSRAALLVRLRVLPLAIGGALVGAAVAGAQGVALALAAATAVGAVLWWRALSGALHRDGLGRPSPWSGVERPEPGESGRPGG